MTDIWFCTDCGQRCTPVEETFDYAWTHCTHGRSGTYRTGNYLSDCCSAELTHEPEYDDSTFANHSGEFAVND